VSGKNLLDQTVICRGSELDMGAAHNHDDTLFVLIAARPEGAVLDRGPRVVTVLELAPRRADPWSAGGKLLTNRLVRFPLNLTAVRPPSTIVDRS
jgi:hypothetical protein